jgi:hypothetical protein
VKRGKEILYFYSEEEKTKALGKDIEEIQEIENIEEAREEVVAELELEESEEKKRNQRSLSSDTRVLEK